MDKPKNVSGKNQICVAYRTNHGARVEVGGEHGGFAQEKSDKQLQAIFKCHDKDPFTALANRAKTHQQCGFCWPSLLLDINEMLSYQVMKKTIVYMQVASALIFGQALFGATLQVTGISPTLSEQFDLTVNGTAELEYPGEIQGILNSVSLGPLFCVDINTPISVAVYNSTLVAPRASRNEDRAAWLLNQEISNVTNAVSAAALQLAIWDIVHDNGDGFSAGTVQSFSGAPSPTPANVITLANTFVAESVGKTSQNAVIYLNTISGTGAPAQALIGLSAAIPSAATPEPSTWALSCGAAIFLFARKRYSSKS